MPSVHSLSLNWLRSIPRHDDKSGDDYSVRLCVRPNAAAFLRERCGHLLRIKGARQAAPQLSCIPSELTKDVFSNPPTGAQGQFMTVTCEACGQSWVRHPALEVACPDCGVRVGAWCMRPSGHRATELHMAREQLSLDRGLLQMCPAITSVVESPPQPSLF
jgi:ribosomal protein S27E